MSRRAPLAWLPFAFVCSTAAAQTSQLADPALTRGVVLPPTSAAITDEATATAVNPAGLNSLEGAQLFYLHERDLRQDAIGDALFLGDRFFHLLGAGLSIEWMRPGAGSSYTRAGLALSLGGEALGLGARYNFFSSDLRDLDRLRSLDLGFQVRPTPFLSLGFAARDVGAGKLLGSQVPARFDLAAGLRPLGRWLTLAVDLLADGTQLENGRASFTVIAEPVDGAVFSAGFSPPLRAGGEKVLQLAVGLNLDRVGATYAAGAGSGPGGMDHVAQLRVSSDRYPSLAKPRAQVAVVDVSEALKAPPPSLLGGKARDPQLSLLQTLRAVARDPDVAALLLRIGDPGDAGFAAMSEIRESIREVRDAGKRVVALLYGGDDPELFLATAAERIYALPQANLSVNGLAASATFFGPALHKLGVKVDVSRVGPFKSAPDRFLRGDLSPEEAQTLNELLDNTFSIYVEAIAAARGKSRAEVSSTLKAGLLTPSAALSAGFIDGIAYPDELVGTFRQMLGTEPSFERAPREGPAHRLAWGGANKIGVVEVRGLIASGRSGGDPFGLARVAGAQTVVEALEAAAADRAVRAIVLRVDSGGGSAAASDLIDRAVRRAKRHKPVVASFGDVAASGGYYVAASADEIVADPTSVTGSIGVFVLKPDLSSLETSLGIHVRTIARGNLAELLSVHRAWTPEEQKAVDAYVEEAYGVFLDRVAEGRKMAKAKVDAVARGRVWSGAAARAMGLVDTLGGFMTALDSAKRRALLSPKEEVEVQLFGPSRPLLELLGDGAAAGAPLVALAGQQGARELAAALLLSREPGTLAAMPYAISVK